MINAPIEGETRRIGEKQGYLGLSIKDDVINCRVNGPDTPVMITAWVPSEEELKTLNEGKPLFVMILGKQHPPIMVAA